MHFSDPEGRFIIADVETEDRIMTLVSVYAPNEDNPTYFKHLTEKLCSFECDFIVFGGDFNLNKCKEDPRSY